MRMLIVADDDHLSDAVQAAQEVLNLDIGSSITITDEENSGQLIACDGYDYVIKNPSLKEILELLNATKRRKLNASDL